MDILVVEDDALVSGFLSLMLPERGFTVMIADSAATANAKIDAYPSIGCLLADFKLGDGDGIGVADTFRRRHPTSGVVVISGDPDEALSRLRGREDYRFLAKPFALQDLIDAVRASREVSANEEPVEALAPITPALEGLTSAC